MTAQATLDRYADHRIEGKLKKFLDGRETTAANGVLSVDFEQVLEFDMHLAKYLLDSPREFFADADRVLEEITGIRGAHLRVRQLPEPSRPCAEKIGKFIEVWGHVVDVADGGSRVKIQDLPKVWVHKLDAPLEVKAWPGWGASWPLRCTISSDLIGAVGLGDHVAATGVLTVERDEETDPARTAGFRYALEVNNIEKPPLGVYAPRWTAERRAISDLFKRLFGHAPSPEERINEMLAELPPKQRERVIGVLDEVRRIRLDVEEGDRDG